MIDQSEVSTGDESLLIAHDTYIDERKELNKYQQTAYDSFEKTLTSLSGFFFTLTTALLAFFSRAGSGADHRPISGIFLIISLSMFFLSLALLLGCFFINARSFTFEIVRLEDALSDSSALNRANPWATASKIVYASTFCLFVVGMASLLFFACVNLNQ